MSCQDADQDCCTQGSVYHSFKDTSNQIFDQSLHNLENIWIRFGEREREWDIGGHGLVGCQDMDQLCETTLQGLHSIMQTTMRSNVEQCFAAKKEMIKLFTELSKVAYTFSNALIEQARLSMSLALMAHENILSAALIKGAGNSVYNMEGNKIHVNSLLESATRHAHTNRDIIGKCIRKSWSNENIAIAALGEKMASFSHRYQIFSRDIDRMRKKTRSKGEERPNLTASLDTLHRYMASQTAKEDQYLLEYERKSLEAKALAEKMSHLQERQNMFFLQRPLLARQHSNQVKQVLQHKMEAMEALVKRLEMSVIICQSKE